MRARLGPLHQPDHRRRAAGRARAARPCAKPASTMCSSASRTPSRRPPTASAAIAAAHAKKLAVAALVRAAGLPLTVNAVVHRQNLDQLEAMIELALELDAHRLEVAHVQYYGWALTNRAALMPTRAQLERRDRDRRARRASGSRAGSSSTMSSPTTTRSGRSPAWAAGAAVPQRHAAGQGAALPCGGIASPGSTSPPSASRPLRWIWQQFAGLPALPRHRLDAGALPLLRAAARSTSAAAAARPWRWPAMPRRPTRPASCRRCTRRCSASPARNRPSRRRRSSTVARIARHPRRSPSGCWRPSLPDGGRLFYPDVIDVRILPG